jgi:hypothetical protein
MPENTPQKDVKQFIIWGLLALCCFLLAGILIILYRNNQIGRYALSNDNDGLFILDTKTSHVWYRRPKGYFDYGTIEKPTFERSIIPAPTKGLVDLGPAPSN